MSPKRPSKLSRIEGSAVAAVLGRKGGLVTAPKGLALSPRVREIRAKGAVARSIPTICKGCGKICPSGRNAPVHCA